MTAGPVFIGGCPRSGLTLLRVIMDGHPQITCGPDAGHVALTLTSADFATTLGKLHEDHFHVTPEDVRRAFARAIAAPMEMRAVAKGKRRWADKTTLNILVFEQLAQLFPEARFIHVVRDGRDVAASLLERGWRAPDGALFDQCASAAGAARYWAKLAMKGLAAEADPCLSPRLMRMRYEDLVANPAAAVEKVCSFVGEPFAPDMLAINTPTAALAGLELETADRLRRPIAAWAVGRWRRDLAREDGEAITAAYRPLFDRFGY